MGRFFNDARYGVRMLLKTPAWTAVMVATLALGIGLATAIFSVVYSVLLQPLPYPEPGRLVALWSTAQGASQRDNVSAANWRDWRAQSQSLQDIAITRPVANFNLTGDGPPERLLGARTSWNLPLVLGVRPLLGRAFTEEEQLGDARVAILSHAFWKRRFGSDPTLVGRKIQLNGSAFEIIVSCRPTTCIRRGNSSCGRHSTYGPQRSGRALEAVTWRWGASSRARQSSERRPRCGRSCSGSSSSILRSTASPARACCWSRCSTARF